MPKSNYTFGIVLLHSKVSIFISTLKRSHIIFLHKFQVFQNCKLNMAKTLGSLCRSTTVEQVYNNNFEFPPALPTKLTPLDLCFEQKCGLYCRCLNEKSRMFAYCILSLQSHNSQVIFTEKQSSLFIVFIQIK